MVWVLMAMTIVGRTLKDMAFKQNMTEKNICDIYSVPVVM